MVLSSTSSVRLLGDLAGLRLHVKLPLLLRLTYLYMYSPTIHRAISSTTVISSLVGKYELAGDKLVAGVSCVGGFNLTNRFG